MRKIKETTLRDKVNELARYLTIQYDDCFFSVFPRYYLVDDISSELLVTLSCYNIKRNVVTIVTFSRGNYPKKEMYEEYEKELQLYEDDKN